MCISRCKKSATKGYFDLVGIKVAMPLHSGFYENIHAHCSVT